MTRKRAAMAGLAAGLALSFGAGQVDAQQAPAAPAPAGPAVLMSAEWAAQACEAWNKDKVLTEDLEKGGWIKNDKGRGYKALHIYRTNCPNDSRVELKIQSKDKKAVCTAGGATTVTPDTSVDYIMHAETYRWEQMGKGEYGPMRAMMFGRLKFDGPKWEAMNNMGPFESFLKLVGKVPSDMKKCNK